MVSLLIVVILTALVFDYINGFHDAANAIATVVSTGVLPVRTAVIIAGLFNFVGAITGTAVAKTISSGFADAAVVSQHVVLAALIGAIFWNLITWWRGIPSSSSHALVGGLAGAVVAHVGISAFQMEGLGSEGPHSLGGVSYFGIHRRILGDDWPSMGGTSFEAGNRSQSGPADATRLRLHDGPQPRFQ